MSRKNIQKVIKAWLAGESASGDSKGTCSTDGLVIWSYGTVIAFRDMKLRVNHILDPACRWFSATTSGQVRAIASASTGGFGVHEHTTHRSLMDALHALRVPPEKPHEPRERTAQLPLFDGGQS